MKDPFVYVPPNAVTTPLYNEVRETEDRTISEISEAIEAGPGQAAYGKINLACKSFYETIERVCPPSADKSAAQRCVVIARMAANEALTATSSDSFDDIVRQCRDNLRAARWQACRAIALNTPDPAEVNAPGPGADFVNKTLPTALTKRVVGPPGQDIIESLFPTDGIARKVLPVTEVLGDSADLSAKDDGS